MRRVLGGIRALAALALAVFASFHGHWAQAAGEDAGGAPQVGAANALQPLPVWTEPPLPAPQPGELERLDALVARLLAPDEGTRREALALLPQVDATWMPAIAVRFERVAQASNKPALEALLVKARQAARTPPDERGARPPAPGVAQDDLALVVAFPERSSPFLRPLTEVLAYGRACEAIGTLDAARHVVAVYTRFGEFLRANTERALVRLRDSALAALIETRGASVPRFADWANRQLVALGKQVPSVAVQVLDPALRADILRAYGKTRDVETAPLMIAFAASERATIRLAARQALVMLGDAGLASLRDAHEKTLGTSAPRAWPWQRLAQELFAALDRQRLSEVNRELEAGLGAEQRGDLGAARDAFDRVLAHDPSFERGELMAPTYLAWAEQHADRSPEEAGIALRRAERLAADGSLRDRALSLRYTLEGRSLLQRGIVDEVLAARARELDPDNRRAETLAEDLKRQTHGDRSTFRRYLAALVIALLALVGLLVMALRQRNQVRVS